MRFFLADLILSSIFNITVVTYCAFELLSFIGETTIFGGLILVFLTLNSILLFANLFTFRSVKVKYVEFKVIESGHGMEYFLKPCTLNGKKNDEPENLLNLYNIAKSSKNNRVSPQSIVDYVEINQQQDDTYEPISFIQNNEEDIYSDVGTYNIAHKPESEQYDTLNCY